MKFFEWLMASSSDASKLSLSVKGILLGALPVLVTLAGLTSINIPDQEALTTIIDLIATLVQVVLGIVAAVITAIGIVRKIWKTWNGTNEVVALQKRDDGSFS